MKKYIEVLRYDDYSLVKRIDVSEKTDRTIDKIEAGLNRNLNHEKYFTHSFGTMDELKEI